MTKTTKWILIGGAVLLVLLFLAQERQRQASAATVNNYGGAAGWLTGLGNLLTAGGKVYGNVTKGSGETSSYSPDIVYGTDSSIGGEN